MEDIIRNIKEEKWVLSTILFLLLFVTTGNDIMSFYQNYIKQKKAEDGLVQLNSGVSIQHVKSIFGPPIYENHVKQLDLIEYIYSFKKFYLQVIFDKENTVNFFAVTTKDKNFNPIILYFGTPLGKNTLNEIANTGYTIEYSNFTSKYYEYAESLYLGNPGNYRTIYLAFNPAGINLESNEFIAFEDMNNEEKIKKMRSKLTPNTFAVGNILGDEKTIIEYIHVGIDYYVSRDLPEHNY